MSVGLISTGKADEDCSWKPKKTLDSLSDSCRWLPALFGQDKETASRALASELGIKSDSEIERVATRNVMDCIGYIYGSMAAGLSGNQIYSNPIYCVSGRPEGLQEEVENPSMDRFRRIGEKLKELRQSSSGIAADFAYETLREELPCPA